jgi:hypothetical protein
MNNESNVVGLNRNQTEKPMDWLAEFLIRAESERDFVPFSNIEILRLKNFCMQVVEVCGGLLERRIVNAEHFEDNKYYLRRKNDCERV